MEDQRTSGLGTDGLRNTRRPLRLSWKHIEDWGSPAACHAILIGLAWWGSSILATKPTPAVATVTAPTVKAAAQPPTATTSSPAVRIPNPFDAREVFEFPSGTSVADGRAKVAQLLLQRARDRRNRWASSTSRQWASNSQRPSLHAATNL